MEAYKQHLLSTIPLDIHAQFTDSPNCKCTTNEDGLLHSYYTGSYYEPAIIYTCDELKNLYWIFNGEIRDCDHPFMISIVDGRIRKIIYYSSDRIKTNKPINIDYFHIDPTLCYQIFNEYDGISTEFMDTKILDEFEATHYLCKYDAQFIVNERVICDIMEEDNKFKFAD